jgi:site-specific recombinase XerD
MRTRRKVMAGREDPGWLFLTETGDRMNTNKFIRGIGSISAFAGLSTPLQMHDLRRYAINKYARK